MTMNQPAQYVRIRAATVPAIQVGPSRSQRERAHAVGGTLLGAPVPAPAQYDRLDQANSDPVAGGRRHTGRLRKPDWRTGQAGRLDGDAVNAVLKAAGHRASARRERTY